MDQAWQSSKHSVTKEKYFQGPEKQEDSVFMSILKLENITGWHSKLCISVSSHLSESWAPGANFEENWNACFFLQKHINWTIVLKTDSVMQNLKKNSFRNKYRMVSLICGVLKKGINKNHGYKEETGERMLGDGQNGWRGSAVWDVMVTWPLVVISL